MDTVLRLMERDRGHALAQAQAKPEEVFLAWLMSLPLDADIAQAARVEIARLDGAEPLAPGPARLRDLMQQALGASQEAEPATQ